MIVQYPEKTEKAQLIGEISGVRNDHLIKLLVRLIDLIVSDTRIENDRAGVRGVFRNQGKIEGLQQLKEYILKGVPSMNKST